MADNNPIKKKRGRPPNSKKNEDTGSEKEVKRGRGRPKKFTKPRAGSSLRLDNDIASELLIMSEHINTVRMHLGIKGKCNRSDIIGLLSKYAVQYDRDILSDVVSNIKATDESEKSHDINLPSKTGARLGEMMIELIYNH